VISILISSGLVLTIEPRAETIRASASTPGWTSGDFWEFNEVYTTVESGGMGPTTYNWDNDVKYTLAGTSNYGGTTCYNLTIFGTFTAVGTMFTKSGMFTGFRLLGQSNLANVYDYIQEGGTGGGLSYLYNYTIAYEPEEDYYDFPIDPGTLPDTWSIMTTKTIHKVGNVGGINVDKTYFASINMAAQCSGTESKSVPAEPNVDSYSISASGGAQSDDRWYSVDLANYIYRDFSETYNNSDTKSGYEELIDTSYSINVKPTVTAIGGEPDSVTNDGSQRSLLRAEVTDVDGLRPNDPVTIDLSPIGGDGSQVMYDDGSNGDIMAGDDTYSVHYTVPLDTAPGDYELFITATDLDGLFNNTEFITLNITQRNLPPVISLPLADPADVPNDDSTETLLSAKVTDENTDTNTKLKEVFIDLSAIGRSGTTPMKDDGQSGDISADDDLFSVRTTVSTSTLQGTYKLMISASDWAASMTFDNITLEVTAANHPPSLSNPKSEPEVFPNDGVTKGLFTVDVKDPDVGDTHTVAIDFSSIGGSSAQPMNDEGEDGDITADDGTYSYESVVSETTSSGVYTLKITARDDWVVPVNVFENITITVSDRLHTPEILELWSSSADVPNDGVTSVTLYANVSDEDDNVDKVTIDLSTLGSSSNKEMKDPNGDGVFTLEITVGSDIAPGEYSLDVTVEDDDGLIGTDILAITVKDSTEFNYAPTVTEPLATPASVPNDDKTETNLTVLVSDQNGFSDIVSVTIDLSPIGKGTLAMSDDGTLIGDLERSYRVPLTIPNNIGPGVYEFQVQVTDGAITDGSNLIDDVTLTLTVTQRLIIGDGPGPDGGTSDQGTEENGSSSGVDTGLIALLIIIVVIVIVVVLLMKRKKPTDETVQEQDPNETPATVTEVTPLYSPPEDESQ